MYNNTEYRFMKRQPKALTRPRYAQMDQLPCEAEASSGIVHTECRSDYVGHNLQPLSFIIRWIMVGD